MKRNIIVSPSEIEPTIAVIQSGAVLGDLDTTTFSSVDYEYFATIDIISYYNVYQIS